MQKLDIIHIDNIPIGTVITQLEKLYDLNLVFLSRRFSATCRILT